MTSLDDPKLGSVERPLRSLAGTVYLPAAAYGIGQGAAAPVIVLAALELGASAAVAGLMVAIVGLGQVIGDTKEGRDSRSVGYGFGPATGHWTPHPTVWVSRLLHLSRAQRLRGVTVPAPALT